MIEFIFPILEHFCPFFVQIFRTKGGQNFSRSGQKKIFMISKICSKFQVLSSHFLRLMSCLMRIEKKIVWRGNISTAMMSPIYGRCDDMYRKRFAVKNSGLLSRKLKKGLLSRKFNLNNLRLTILRLHAKIGSKAVRYMTRYGRYAVFFQ